MGKKRSGADATAELRDVGKRLAILRAKLPADSSLAGAAFRLAAIIGEMEAVAASRPPLTPEKPE